MAKHVEKRRYRKVLCRMYGDERFMALSRPKPNAQTLWVYLLTGPHTMAIPGLFVAGQAALAEALEWSVPDLRRCWMEIESQGMAEADWIRRVVWLPKAVDHNEPENPNVVNAWRKAMSEIPECPIKDRADIFIAEFLQAKGANWIEAWRIEGPEAWNDDRLRRAMRKEGDLRQNIKARDLDLCRYCGREVNWINRRGQMGATYDHVNPSGPTSFLNLVTACRSCNSKKRHRTPEQAGMRLLDPGTYLGTSDAPTQVPSPNQEQEQEQEQENTPQPPASGGRPTRAHRKHAAEVLRLRFGRCQHEPACANHAACLDATAHELAAKAVAS